MLGKKGKIFVLTGMIALLVLTGVLNIILNNQVGDQQAGAGDDTSASDFFAELRTDRESGRTESILLCDAIINDGTSSQEAIRDAEEAKQFYVNAIEIERVLEALIVAVGFEDAVVTTTTENVNVIVKTPELTSELVGRIREIVSSETGKTANNMRIYRVD